MYLARSIKPKTVLLKRDPQRDPIREERRFLEQKNPGDNLLLFYNDETNDYDH